MGGLAGDTTQWIFLSRQEKLVKEGVPAELDFSVLDSAGNDIAQEHFSYEGVTLWVVCGDPRKGRKSVGRNSTNLPIGLVLRV